MADQDWRVKKMTEALTESPPDAKAYCEMGAKRRRSDWEHTIREGPRCGRRDEDATGPIGFPVLATVEAICCDSKGNIQTLGVQRALGRRLNESG